MSVFDEIVYNDEKNRIVYEKWVEWEHVGSGLNHCKLCKILDECWFNDKIKPVLPLHDRCHCYTNVITKPNARINAVAKCDIRKFTEYIFGEKYKWNGKCGLFEKLGFTRADSKYLKYEYEKQAVQNYCDSQYVLSKLDEQGQRINIDIKLKKNGRNLVFTSGWMVKPKGEITNNTPLAD